jgi:hypothetical protein
VSVTNNFTFNFTNASNFTISGFSFYQDGGLNQQQPMASLNTTTTRNGLRDGILHSQCIHGPLFSPELLNPSSLE